MKKQKAKIKKVMKGLQKASKTHANQAKTLKGVIIGLCGAFKMIIDNLPTAIGLLVAFKTASFAASIASSVLAVTKATAATALIGGIGGVIIAGVLAGLIAKAMTSVPKAQTGISGFGGGLLQVGESGPEIMNVPRGTNVMSAEPTRQALNDGGFGKIESALEQVRPFLESDGGDIRLIEVTDDYVVKVKLLGACSDCKVSMMTLKAGVEQAIKKVLPEVQKVVDIDKLED